LSTKQVLCIYTGTRLENVLQVVSRLTPLLHKPPCTCKMAFSSLVIQICNYFIIVSLAYKLFLKFFPSPLFLNNNKSTREKAEKNLRLAFHPAYVYALHIKKKKLLVLRFLSLFFKVTQNFSLFISHILYFSSFVCLFLLL
jgi:hypothetical protein